ncbi:hypothetical protein MCOR25_000851 [Pyricularia grisea]|nr:hypothetical protein MCOR25_000851 [Pyricularia grisea]
MAIKHNNQIPHNHFRKDWQRRVRCHFDQPGKKASRRIARRAKAAKVAPRPVDLLRPVVQCPTIKYNRRARLGRGFTLDELKAAGLHKLQARTIGISVDGRRRNLSEESLARNVERLKAYKAKLVVMPKKGKKPEVADKTAHKISAVVPIVPPVGVTEISKSDIPKSDKSAYRQLREARAKARHEGKREKRVREKADEEKAKK